MPRRLRPGAFVDFIGDAAVNSNPVQKNLTVNVHSLKFFSSLIQKMSAKELSLQVVNPHAAGIDVGSRSYMVAIDQIVQNVREFGVYTQDHESMIDYFKVNGITTIAMESTGSYWQTLFHALQCAGFEVMLVCGNQTKNVKGKKTDVLDCMWIQKLHTLGILSGSFLLNDQLQILRTYYGHRKYLIEQCSKYINKMQNALRLMNFRLDVVVNDIMGTSGRAIIEAILNGCYNPAELASLASSRLKKSRQEIESSLHGQYREELLFELKSCMCLYDHYNHQIRECDQKIEALLKNSQQPNTQGDTGLQASKPIKNTNKKVNKNSPSFNVCQLAYAHLNTDLFEIEGVSHSTVLCFLCSMGTDIKKFATAKQFASWLRLVPNNKKTGGRIVSSRTPKGKNDLALALRQAANIIGSQKSYSLNPFFMRVAYRKGRAAAITATARKLAIIIWNMVVKCQSFKKTDSQITDHRKKTAEIRKIENRITKLNLSDLELKDIFRRYSVLTS